MLNRSALIVRPRQPFLDWAAQLDDSQVIPSVEDEQSVYLVPSFEDDEELEAVLKNVYREIFESELFGWHTDKTAWPKKRSLATFKQWFQIEWHTIVEDLCAYEIVDDDV